MATPIAALLLAFVLACLATRPAWASGTGASAAPTASPPAASNPSPQTTSGGAMALASQTSWVSGGANFEMHLAIAPGLDRAGSQLSVSVFPKVTSRSAFRQSLQGRVTGSALRSLPEAALNSLPTDQAGNVVFSFSTAGYPGVPLTSCSGGCDGIYPVRVTLSESSGASVLDRFTTHLIVANPLPGTQRLNFAWVVPFQARPSLQPDGQWALPTATSDRLFELASGLQVYQGVPVTLDVSPETLQALESSSVGRARDASTVAILAHLPAASHQVVQTPYVPIDLPGLTESGLSDEVGAQLERGGQVLSSVFGPRRDTATWITTGGLSPSALGQLQSDSITQVVVPDSDLAPYGGKLTLTQTFGLAGRSNYQPQAASTDEGLGTHFANGGDPVLQAHQMLADLAAIYFDEPSVGPRSVVAEPPVDWQPSAAFVNALMNGLATSPIVSPVTLNSVFRLHLPQGNNALVRRIVPNTSSPSLPVGGIRDARKRLDAFATVVSTDNPLIADMNDLLLVSQSIDLRTSEQARYVTGLRTKINNELAQVSLAQDRSVTLTSRDGRIPITIISDAPYTVHAVLTVASDKLKFPHGASQIVSLDQRNNARYVDVQSRASGDFPMNVSLVSPQGGLVLLQARFTVRSTTASGVGVALSISAGAILVGWWLRTFVKGRRQRREFASSEE